MTDDGELRIAALMAAGRIVGNRHGCEHDVFDIAERLYQWLAKPLPPVHLNVTVGPVSKQNTHTKDGIMQLRDDEQVDLSVTATDAKGQPVTGDTVTWTVDDESVVTLKVSDDTKTATVVAGTVGSAVVTLTDGTVTATEAVDVVAGDVALVTIAVGTPVKQTPAAEAPAPGDAPAA